MTDEKQLIVQQQMSDIDRQIRASLKPLNARHSNHLNPLAQGGSQEKAAIEAGYSAATAYTAACRLLRNVRVSHAYELMRWKNQLQHGIDVGLKRQMLLEIAETARTQGDNYQPRAAVAALAELNRMDGDVQSSVHLHKHDTKVSISYDLNIPARQLPATDSGQGMKTHVNTVDAEAIDSLGK